MVGSGTGQRGIKGRKNGTTVIAQLVKYIFKIYKLFISGIFHLMFSNHLSAGNKLQKAQLQIRTTAISIES